MDLPKASSSRQLFATPPPKRAKVDLEGNVGMTVLLTGIAKSGKSTISNNVYSQLTSLGIRVKQLDGKELRAGLCSELDFDKESHRSSFVHLSSEAAKLFTKEGYVTLLSIVAPKRVDRENARTSHEQSGLKFMEVFVDRDREEARRQTGLHRNVLNPIDLFYEPPTQSYIHLERDGNNLDGLSTQLVNNILEKVRPGFALSPMAVPSPSTSMDSSMEVDSGNDKFKLPNKGSMLMNIFQFIKPAVIARGFRETYREIKTSPEFLALMVQWKQHYDDNINSEDHELKWHPVLIPYPPKNTTPRKKLKDSPLTDEAMEEDTGSSAQPETPSAYAKYIPLYFNGEALQFGMIGFKGCQYPANKICKVEDCWGTTNNVFCRAHAPKRMNHFAVLIDSTEQGSRSIAALSQPLVKKQAWTNTTIKSNAKAVRLLLEHLTNNPKCKFQEIFAKSLPYSSELKLSYMHTAELSVSLIVLFRNIERLEEGAVIQPHQFLRSRLDIFSANLAVVEQIVNKNGISFNVEEDETPPPALPLITNNFCPKLPSVYIGSKQDKIYIGVKVSMIGSDAQSSTHELRGQIFTCETLYQPQLTQEELKLGNSMSQREKDWSPAQATLHKRVAEDCHRKESLGQAVLLIAAMKNLSNKGNLIVPANVKLEHVNSAFEGDKIYIQTVFKYLTGHTLTITVNHLDSLNFEPDFLE